MTSIGIINGEGHFVYRVHEDVRFMEFYLILVKRSADIITDAQAPNGLRIAAIHIQSRKPGLYAENFFTECGQINIGYGGWLTLLFA